MQLPLCIAMETRQDDIMTVLRTNHPARPYLVMGALVAGLGLMRHSLLGLGMAVLGGGLIARGLDEMRRVEELHGGNFHGVNAPPMDV